MLCDDTEAQHTAFKFKEQTSILLSDSNKNI